MDEKRANTRAASFHFVTLISQNAGDIRCAISNKSSHGLGLIAAGSDDRHFSQIHVGEYVLVRMEEQRFGERKVVRVLGRVAHASPKNLGLSLSV